MKPSGIVSLLTDFGQVDGYVAAVKGVLLSQAPRISIVDISHQVPRHEIATGAFILASAAPYFPSGTVHIAVVDPGVGSCRAPIALRARRAWFVGPDNGLLWQAVGESVEEMVVIEHVPGNPLEMSSTFHGRDLFAPAGALLARGGALSELGPPKSDLLQLDIPFAERTDQVVKGVVVHIDGFGNIITNIRREDLPETVDRVVVRIGETLIRGLVSCYADVPMGTLCSLFGSDDLLEISIAEGDAAGRLDVDRGDQIVCRVLREG